MTLALSAKPTIVAREAPYGASARWDWVIPSEDVGPLRAALADGLVATAQRRDTNGGFVLLAWNIPAQEAAAGPLKAKREERKLRQMLLAPAGYTPRVYKPARRSVGMPTHAPYMHEPGYW